jgi:hypothetical protein
MDHWLNCASLSFPDGGVEIQNGLAGGCHGREVDDGHIG